MRSLRGLRRADHGSSLILVLIIISVVSLVMGVVIAQADTSVRTTVALRDQASDNYAADGATQAVLNGLKTSGINCTDPSNPTPVVLGSISTPFYVPTSSVQGSLNAYAKCTPDALVGASTTMVTPPPVTSTTMVTPPPVTSTAPFLGGGDPTLPSYALLTTGS
jgi:Tfp pilus assembly protein PilX